MTTGCGGGAENHRERQKAENKQLAADRLQRKDLSKDERKTATNDGTGMAVVADVGNFVWKRAGCVWETVRPFGLYATIPVKDLSCLRL